MTSSFEVTMDLDGRPDDARISGHAAVWSSYAESGPVYRLVFVDFVDRRLVGSKVAVQLTVDQAERTGRMLLELAERARAMPAPPDHETAQVGTVTAWPAERSHGR